LKSVVMKSKDCKKSKSAAGSP